MSEQKKSDSVVTCEQCDGSGMVDAIVYDDDGEDLGATSCGGCLGTGSIPRHDCGYPWPRNEYGCNGCGETRDDG